MIGVRIGLAALFLAIPASGQTGAPAMPYAWQSVKIGGGGFAPGIVFSPAERGLAYLRTDMGGAYRFDARANRWVPLQDDEAVGSYMGIESVAPDPTDADRVYLAAGMGAQAPAAIFRSADRGATWAKTPVPFAMGGNEDGRGMGERLAVDPHAPATLLFGSRHDGLWRSGDRGATWRKVDGFPLPGLGAPTQRRQTHGGLSFVLFDPAVRGRILVASADPGERHLFRSDDGGGTWRAVPGGPSPALLPAKGVIGANGVLTVTLNDGIGPHGVTRGAVWRLDLRSGDWRDVTPDKAEGAPPGGYMGVAASRQRPCVLAVSTLNRSSPGDTVWRSADCGRTWDTLAPRSTRDVSATPFVDVGGKPADFGHWIAGLAIDPFDDRRAAYVTGATMYATDAFDARGTMAWRPWTDGIEQTAVITIVSPSAGAPLVSGFGDIAGFVHDDLTRSPPRQHLNPYLTNTNTLDYAGLAPKVMVRNGSTHTREVPGASIAWSTDGGYNWTPLLPRSTGASTPERTGDAAITVSADGATFLVETDGPQLTRDRGRTWQPVRGLPSRVRVTADKADPRRFYALDFAANRLVRSDDGGATFAPVAASGLPADLSSAREVWREAQNPMMAVPGAAGHLWLRVGPDLYRSTDAGVRWQKASGGLAVRYYGLGRAAPGSRWPAVYAVGTLTGLDALWRSTDGGGSWIRINDDRHQWGMRFRAIIGDPKRFGRVYVATDGRGILYGDPQE